ncbi:MerR family transcriptional regulator [Streptomyces sp. cmx-4-9]|uniref:DNA polymerase III subunit beta family protein n=1 Tax=Streptomyces sp. cmx-4-9 TaxID=2790941 RepID=UPI003980F1AD
MRSIGEMARDSGLSVSALRFYDGAGVLVPDRVDPVSGYRWYGAGQLDESRLLARLRRTGMPLADIRLVLAGWSGTDTDLVLRLLDAHLRRLEAGLSDARTEFSALRALLACRENPVTTPPTAVLRLTVPAPALAAALDAVRFAAGSDPELPVLGGVLFDAEGPALRVVATDRYRLAVARSAADGHDGPRVQAIVPTPLVDAMRALLGDDPSVRLTVDGGRVALETGDRQVAGRCLDHDFPDYRRLVRLPAGRRAPVDAAALREALERGPVRGGGGREQDGSPRGISVLAVGDDGLVTVCGGEDGEGGPDRIAVDRGFLLDALAAAGGEELFLEYGGPTAPLAVRRTDTEETFSLLMPVRLED